MTDLLDELEKRRRLAQISYADAEVERAWAQATDMVRGDPLYKAAPTLLAMARRLHTERQADDWPYEMNTEDERFLATLPRASANADKPCDECGEVHHGGVVILDDNILSLTAYIEAHPKRAKEMGL